MDNYFTIISLLGLRNQNLPPFREARLKRYRSIKKMVELIETAGWTQPKVPFSAFCLSSQDPEWEDDMTYPVIEYNKFGYQAVAFGINLFLYAYNYNVITQNIRFRTMRYLFPVVQCFIFSKIYYDYKSQLTKVNLFDEYVQLRAQELVKENEYLMEHEDSSGGMKITKKPYVEFTDKLMIMLQQISKILNSFYKILFADIQIQIQQDHLMFRKKEFCFEIFICAKKNKFTSLYININLQSIRMILIEVVILIGSTVFGLLYSTTKCLDYIHDSVKLIIFSTFLIDYPWMVIGLEGFVWFKELQQNKQVIEKKESDQQQQVPPQIILNGQKDGITSASNDIISQKIEAVQIFDYISGESQYALIQKADKSLLTQLGVTLKNTVFLEKGRPEAQSQSKLVSQLDHQKQPAINNNTSIKYEDSHEFQKNQKRIQVSIPFKIGDFDQQMGEIVQAEIMSNAQSNHPLPIIEETAKDDYEKILIAILFAGGLPFIHNIFFRIINALIFGVIIHETVFREEILTMSHFTLIMITLSGCAGMYTLGLFFNFQLLIIGALIWSFSKVNQNLALLILPMPTLLMFIGI